MKEFAWNINLKRKNLFFKMLCCFYVEFSNSSFLGAPNVQIYLTYARTDREQTSKGMRYSTGYDNRRWFVRVHRFPLVCLLSSIANQTGVFTLKPKILNFRFPFSPLFACRIWNMLLDDGFLL